MLIACFSPYSGQKVRSSVRTSHLFLSAKADRGGRTAIYKQIFIILIILIFFPGRCGAEKVGLLLPEKDGDWEKNGLFLQEQLNAAGVAVELVFCDNDAGKQKAELKRMILKKPDLLLLAAVDPADLEKTAEEAAQAGIIVIAYDRMILSRRIPWCIAFDSRQAGEAQGAFLSELLDLDHARDSSWIVEFLKSGGAEADPESGRGEGDEDPQEADPGPGRGEGGADLQGADPDPVRGEGGADLQETDPVLEGAMDSLQPYIDEGLLTILARPSSEAETDPVLPDLLLSADAETALRAADRLQEKCAGKKAVIICTVGLNEETAGALRSGALTMTAFCPWEYEAAVAVDLALALLDGETVSQDWVEHAGFSFECSLGSRFVSGDLKNDTLFLSPLTVTADNLEQILCCYSGPF